MGISASISVSDAKLAVQKNVQNLTGTLAEALDQAQQQVADSGQAVTIEITIAPDGDASLAAAQASLALVK